MRRDMFFVVGIFFVCTFLIGALLRQSLIIQFWEWDIEPSFGLLSTLNILLSLPLFGLLTYLRYAIWDDDPLPFFGHFVWVSPIAYAMILACYGSPFTHTPGIIIIFSVFGCFIWVGCTYLPQIAARKRKQDTQDEGGI